MDPSFSPIVSAETANHNPTSRIPQRRSSRFFHPQTSLATSALSSPSRNAPPPPPHTSSTLNEVVTLRGKSCSPIKRSSLRTPLSRTFVPHVLPTDVLDVPRLTHPRVTMHVRLTAPVFMGGATVEGDIGISIDRGCSETKRRSLTKLSLTRVSVSVVGIERCKTRQHIFRALATNVLHASDPAIHEDALLPFHLDLPVLMGPPPYKGKKAGITYLLSCLGQFEIGEKTYFVRHSREVIVLTVHDRRSSSLYERHPNNMIDQAYSGKSTGQPLKPIGSV